MSYYAAGEGWLVLRMDEQARAGLKEKMLSRYDEFCRVELASAPALRLSICQRYEAEKQELERTEPCEWLDGELSNLGFCDISAEEDPNQQTLYIEMSFDGKYYEEPISKLLDALSPWTVEGSLSFRGEDAAIWRLYFTGAEWTDQSGEISYAETTGSCSAQDEGPYPPLVEDVGTFEALLSEVESRLRSDARPAPQRGRQLMTAFQNQDPDGVLLALTGWSLRSLGALAGIWQATENTT